MKIEQFSFEYKNNFSLLNGSSIEGFELVYETYGELNAKKNNAVLVCHAFSGSHHAAGVDEINNKPGWWHEFIGPGKALDTDKYFVVSPNNLGSCYGSTGPLTHNKETGKPYGPNFPALDVYDWVASQDLLRISLGIEAWEMVLGGSLGGMQALEWSISFPSKIKKAGIIAATALVTSQNIALNQVAREIIRKDAAFENGDYLLSEKKPKDGLKVARMLGHITYLSETNFKNRFGRRLQDINNKIDETINFEVENYLRYQGEKFSEYFDANSYILLTKVMDSYNPAARFDNSIVEALKNCSAKLLIISFDDDWLFPSQYSKELHLSALKAGVQSSFLELTGNNGHDSFLFPTEEYVSAIKNFLNHA
ncbi:MAG: homoserine O-acetyltransferase [Gammaproteobacteria bacterium]